MPAVIQSTLYESPGGPVVPASTQANSRDDLRLGYQVVLTSVHAASTYSWTLAFASDSPGSTVPGTPFDGTQSGSALLAPEGSTSQDAKFNVDYEGTYLIRLTVDAGLVTEDTQFIRARVLTLFGAIKLVAAGERRDELGVIPVDATPEGWANDQNANMQRISLLIRRYSTSGRVLFVDANRGRDSAAAQDDYDNVIGIPGPDAARREETGIKLRAMAHGDFSSINDAIAYAAAAATRGEPAPSKTNPYFIRIRPGFYNEDLNLTSFVHLVGEWAAGDPRAGSAFTLGPQVKPVVIRTLNTGGVGTHIYNPQQPGTTDECFLFNLHLENTANTTNPVVYQQGGLLLLEGCVVLQQGDDAAQGAALHCETANPAYAPQLWVVRSNVTTEATTADRYALYLDAPASVLMLVNANVGATNCIAVGLNSTLYEFSAATVSQDSIVAGTVPIQGYPSQLTISHSAVVAAVMGTPALDITPPGGIGAKPGDVAVSIDHCSLTGTIQFLTANAVGATALNTSSVTNLGVTAPGIDLPDAPGDLPNVMQPYTRADTLWYMQGYSDPREGVGAPPTIPVLNQVPEEDVQRILDILWQGTFPVTGSPFFDLNAAYNGLATISPFTPGVGLGRNIDALGGAVQIQGATYPTGLESHLKYGGLQVEGVIDIGGFINGLITDTVADVGGSEIHLNPNMSGSGPFLGLGRASWPNGVVAPDRGFAGAAIVAGGAQLQAGTSAYHLHLRTADLRAPNTGKTGNVYMVAGGIGDLAGVDAAGEVHIVGGSHANPAGTVGNIWLVPGNTDTPSAGATWFVGAPDPVSGALRASLTPVGVYVGGQAGTVYFGTPTGIEALTFTGLEANIAAVVASIAAQAKHIRAVDVVGVLVLYSEYGPAGDIIYLGDDVAGALNTALGDYILGNGAVFSPGAYGDKVAVDVPSDGRLRLTGDLEVTGTIFGGGSLGSHVAVAFGMSPYAVGVGEGSFSCDATLGNVSIVLPSAAASEGRYLWVRHADGLNYVVLTPQGGDTVGGLALQYIRGGSDGVAGVYAGTVKVLFSDGGTDWKVWNIFQPPAAQVYTLTASWSFSQVDDYWKVIPCQLSAGVDIDITLTAPFPMGWTLTFKDESGLANAIPAPGGQKIHIVDSGGATFDGAASLDITVAYAAVTIYRNATGNWSII